MTQERPNVYYELGYAHGVGNESSDVLLVAERGTVLHFDVAPLRVQYYSSETELRDVVAEQLKRSFGNKTRTFVILLRGPLRSVHTRALDRRIELSAQRLPREFLPTQEISFTSARGDGAKSSSSETGSHGLGFRPLGKCLLPILRIRVRNGVILPDDFDEAFMLFLKPQLEFRMLSRQLSGVQIANCTSVISPGFTVTTFWSSTLCSFTVA